MGTLARLFRVIRYPERSIILRPGDRSGLLFAVLRGEVGLSYVAGRAGAIDIPARPGEVFALDLMLGATKSPYTATALADCELVQLDRADLDELGAREPAILATVLASMAGHVRFLVGAPSPGPAPSGDQALTTILTFEERVAGALTRWGGSGRAFALGLLALIAWTWIGGQGLRPVRLAPIDPPPYHLLTLILKVVAAVWAGSVLVVLNRFAFPESSATRPRAALLDRLRRLEASLDDCRWRALARLGDGPADLGVLPPPGGGRDARPGRGPPT